MLKLIRRACFLAACYVGIGPNLILIQIVETNRGLRRGTREG